MAEHTGELKGFSVNNGWTAIDLDGAPKGISTKKKDVVDAVKELVGQQVTARWTEKDSDKINENTGKPYVNRWLDSVTPAANGNSPQAPAPAAVASSASPSVRADAPGSGEGPDLTTRERAWVAAAFLSAKAPSFDGAKSLARRIHDDIVRGDWGGAFGRPDDPDSDVPF